MLRDEIEPYWPQWADNIETMAQSGGSRIFEVLVDAGVVEWINPETVSTSFDSYPRGGIVRLTALGRYVLPDDLLDAGYLLRLDDLAGAPASALIDALDFVPDEQRQMVADAWRPTLEFADRVRQIVDLVGSADDSTLRLRGFGALELFDAQVVGPAVRGLLDGPAAGQAALYLLARGLADGAEVSGLIDIGVFVDVLAASLDEPEELYEMFSAAPHSADQFAALEQMWQHPSPTPPPCSTRSASTYPTASSQRPPARARSVTAAGSPTAPEVLRAKSPVALLGARSGLRMARWSPCDAVSTWFLETV